MGWPSLQRRAPAIPSLTLQKPQQITVEEWENKAPLDERERRSVARLKEICENRPFPAKFASETAVSTRPGTPSRQSPYPAGSPHTPAGAPTSRLHPSAYPPFTTAVALNDYLDVINASIEHEQEAHYRSFLHELDEYIDTCNAINERLDSVEHDVQSMLESWRSVESGSTRIQGASEQMLEERDRLVAISEELSFRLEYFQQLEEATRMLNHPGESLVLQTEFLHMIERVDVCFDYLTTHRHFKEAELYLLRFQQCMTRAMTLIKMYFVGMLKALQTDVQTRLANKDISDIAQHHLLYSRFQSVSAQVVPLLRELERHAALHPEDVSSLLTECHTAYFTVRRGLLVGRIIEEIKILDPERSELVELTRAGCSYLKLVCTNEFDLFRLFFTSGEDAIYRYLEGLCDYLYDDLRPRILHEPRLLTLCSVCTVIQALMVMDVEVPPTGASIEMHTEPPAEDPLARLQVSHLLQMVLQDAQTRLLFKAQSVLQSDIGYYAPKPGDLEYPGKLQNVQNPEKEQSQSIVPQTEQDSDALFRLPSQAVQDTWYPTLSKTIWILALLHDFVKPAIFQDIAQEAIGLCRHSLSAASDLIAGQSEAGQLDALLFFVQHLLVLKEVVASLELDYVRTERGIWVDGVTETLGTLLRSTSSLLRPTAIFSRRAQSNIVMSDAADPKIAIDSDLKRVCEDIISICTDEAIAPIRAFRERLANHTRTKAGTASAAQQEWGKPAALLEIDAKFKEDCSSVIRKWIDHLELYLQDPATVAVLVPPMQARIVEEYRVWRDLVRDEYEWGTADKLMREPQVWDFVREATGEPYGRPA
ncbi:Sec34-domain-containing protein [Dacryopinax primogenitus]|uniref:Conserved oligomeric Golgi complex subunit 3 n=1 Tax=Dacryopinax primogenitus (strain DJM 731) TaxID=1858805 RepID=M5GFG0_DACPD|nr:Sec34-domain-containing protein [Dacryopinax primogenitus]EJU04113.1 Sec34-domain-containing protein [Dacryopinax primogenitus]